MPSRRIPLIGPLVLVGLVLAAVPMAWSDPQPIVVFPSENPLRNNPEDKHLDGQLGKIQGIPNPRQPLLLPMPDDSQNLPTVFDTSIFEGRTPGSLQPYKWPMSTNGMPKPNGGSHAIEVTQIAQWNSEFLSFAELHGDKLGGVARLEHKCTSGSRCANGFITLGSGFLIGEEKKHILTAAHIFWPKEESLGPYDIRNFRVKFDAMSGYEVVIREIKTLMGREDDDLLLIELSKPVLQRASLNLRPQNPDASRAFTVGYPTDPNDMMDENYWGTVKSGDLVLSPGTLQRVEYNPTPSQRKGIFRHTVLNTALLARGNSGSPLLDVETGDVLGIHVCWYEGRYNLAVRTSYWDEFAEKLRQPPSTMQIIRPAVICDQSFLKGAVFDRRHTPQASELGHSFCGGKNGARHMQSSGGSGS